MTAEERQAIRERVEAAKAAYPGEWRVFVNRWEFEGTPMTLYDVDCNQGRNPDDMSERFSITEDMGPEVAEFIAHAPADITALLGELRLARELLFRFAPINSVIACFLWPDAECEKPYRGQLDAIRRELEESK